MIHAKDIQLLLADTYYEAAKQDGMDMRRFTAIIEDLRPYFTEQPNYQIWKHIRLEKTETNHEALLKSLATLRHGYVEMVFKNATQRIKTAFEKSPEEGFRAWLDIYVNALVNWESYVYDRIDDLDLPFPAQETALVKNAQRYHDYVRDNRWGDCYERYAELAQHPLLTPEQSAQLHLIAGQIQLYHLLNSEAALRHFETARDLAPVHTSKIERSFGEWQLKKQAFDAARLHFMNAMALDLDDAENYISLGDSYRDERRWNLAEDYYRQAIQKNPLETGAYERLLYLYGETDFFKEKEGELPELLHKIELLQRSAADKKYGNWRYNAYRAMGWCYYRNEQYATAVEWYQKAVQLQPLWISALLDLGNTCYALQQHDQAKKHYDKAEQAAPNAYDVCWVLAWYHEQKADYEQALAYYQRCIDARPSAAKNIRSAMATLCTERLQDAPRAIALLAPLVETHPDDAALQAQLGAAYALAGQAENAENAYQRALEIQPGNFTYWNELGILRYRKKDYEAAAPLFQKALALNPGDPVLHGNLADTYSNAGWPEKAFTVIENAVAQLPSDPELQNRMGNLCYDRKQYEAALPFFKKAAELQPDNATYHGNVAAAYKMLKNWAEAEPWYAAAIQRKPDNDFYHNEMAIATYHLGKFQDSAAHFLEAARLAPTHPVYMDNYAQALEMLPDQTQNALAAYQKAIELAPQQADYHVRLAQLMGKTGREREAAHYLIDQIRALDEPAFLPPFLELYQALDYDADVQATAQAALEHAPRVKAALDAMIQEENGTA